MSQQQPDRDQTKNNPNQVPGTNPNDGQDKNRQQDRPNQDQNKDPSRQR